MTLLRACAQRPFPALLCAAGLAFALIPTPAAAQDDPDEVSDEDEDEDDDEVMEFDAVPMDRPSGEVPTGATETPVPPKEFDAPPEIVEETGPPPPRVYPVELALRPVALLPGVAEVGLDAPLFVSPAAVTTTLRARYGVIDHLELGLRYGIVAADEDGGVSGKTVGIDITGPITDWVAAQLTVPILLDPFAMGITLGAPLKFHLGRSLGLFFGRDLVSVRVSKFVPSIDDPRVNRGLLAALDTNTTVSRGDLRFIGGIIYQIQPNLAVTADGGVVAPDFRGESAQVPLGGTVTWSPLSALDLAARLGFADLGDGDTFGLTFGAAARL
ncbi:hypothetical protein [Haliangium sp.]|uniref:hypothetical protein n=1 Tax=Haliangium sp. TaxID=2663208 RepID=UPI003D140B40